MTDFQAEQEMEIEALEAILMEDFQEVDDKSPVPSGLQTDAKVYQITVLPKGDDEDEPTEFPVRLALFFAHTPSYPDEPPLFSVKSLQGVKQTDVEEIKAQLEEEVQTNLGMSMMYTLATSAKEWLIKKYGKVEEVEDDEEKKEEVIEPHGLPVTEETFNDWRERFEAEKALERAKLLSDTALIVSKEKRLSGRQWYLQRAGKGIVVEEEEDDGDEEDEDIDFDEEDFEDEDLEEDMLEHYLAKK